MKIDLGSGKEKLEGYTSIDILPVADIQRDLENQCLPFGDNTIDEVRCHSFLEHVDNLWFVLDEAHRVLKTGGVIDILVPNGLYIAPDHKRYFTEKFFKKYLTTGPTNYQYTDRHWKLVDLQVEEHTISAKLTPIKNAEIKVSNKLNLGCGAKMLPSYLNIDIVPPADLVWDVTKGLPFDDNSLDRIDADNLLEHLDNKQFMFLMNECHRVLKSGGILWFIVPDALNWPDGAMGDPTHCRFFVPRSFNYFTDCPTYHNYGKSYGFKMWNLVDLQTDNRFFTCQLKK